MTVQPIENYGIIGNLCTAALVSIDSLIDFLCFPEFDSSFAIPAEELDTAWPVPDGFGIHDSSGNSFSTSSSDVWHSGSRNGSGTPGGWSRSGVRRMDSATDCAGQ